MKTRTKVILLAAGLLCGLMATAGITWTVVASRQHAGLIFDDHCPLCRRGELVYERLCRDEYIRLRGDRFPEPGECEALWDRAEANVRRDLLACDERKVDDDARLAKAYAAWLAERGPKK